MLSAFTLSCSFRSAGIYAIRGRWWSAFERHERLLSLLLLVCWLQLSLFFLSCCSALSASLHQTHSNCKEAHFNGLKGQCHEIFDFCFFSWISFPQAPEYTNRAVSNFFENSRRYSQLKVHHRCRWHRWQMAKIFKLKNFNYFVWTPLGSRVVRHVTGNDKDYLRKIPRVVW